MIDCRKNSDARCSIRALNDNVVIGLQGPKASRVVSDLIEFSQCSDPKRLKASFLSISPPIPFKLSIVSSTEKRSKASLTLNHATTTESALVSSQTSLSYMLPALPLDRFSQSTYPYMSTFELLFEYEGVDRAKVSSRHQSKAFHRITCLRIGTTGEDGFEFIINKRVALLFATFVPQISVDLFCFGWYFTWRHHCYSSNRDIVLSDCLPACFWSYSYRVLLWSRHTSEAGLLALDMLRMESGFSLPGHDYTRLETPVQVCM